MICNGEKVFKVLFQRSNEIIISELPPSLYYFTYNNCILTNELFKIWSLILNEIDEDQHLAKKLIEIIENPLLNSDVKFIYDVYKRY